ncbi:MAG: BON domain-containing protein [Nitrospiraceae bacterium]|nr:MAG: BON domain-containing protein [Nitrospiraceae bacterium]
MKRGPVLITLIPIVLAVFFSCRTVTGRSAGEIIDDGVITSEINAKILRSPDVSYLKINVDTTEGDVVLTGSVPSKEAEERLINIVNEVRGVKSVKSELKIRQDQ